MTKKVIKRYSQAERKGLVELYRQSGYSVWRFCKEMNLGYETLKRWLKEEPPKYGLVEVTVGDTPPVESVTLTIRLPNGIVCEVGTALSPEETLNWVRALRTC